jgi:hypothetical protein
MLFNTCFLARGGAIPFGFVMLPMLEIYSPNNLFFTMKMFIRDQPDRICGDRSQHTPFSPSTYFCMLMGTRMCNTFWFCDAARA